MFLLLNQKQGFAFCVECFALSKEIQYIKVSPALNHQKAINHSTMKKRLWGMDKEMRVNKKSLHTMQNHNRQFSIPRQRGAGVGMHHIFPKLGMVGNGDD